MMPNVHEYHEDCLKSQKRYLELIQDYSGLPSSRRSQKLCRELDKCECALLDNSPIYPKNGTFSTRSKGLRLPTGAEVSRYQKNIPTGDFKTIDQNRWANLIRGRDAVKLSSLVEHKLDQDGVGSCGAEGLTQGIMVRQYYATGEIPEQLSPLFMYNTTSGGRDQGSSLPSNIEFAKKYGVASAKVWPRSKGWRATPSEKAVKDARNNKLLEVSQIRNWVEFGTALLLGWPVYFGYTGHAILAVELLDSSRFRYINSWSEDWGEEGFGTLHKDRIYWNYGVFAIRTVTFQLAT